MAKKVLTFAVCGYGGAFNMGRGHSQQLEATGRAKLVAVCDPDVSRQKAARDEFPGIATFGSLKELLAKSAAEMIIIITPHNTHAALALEALKAKRHVIVEKPMCITHAEAAAMVKAARAAKVMLSVYHNRRWDPDYVTIKGLVESGAIGDVFSVRCHMAGYGYKQDWWRADKKVSGGCLYDWGAHMVDWTLGLVPAKARTVTGFSQKRVWKEMTIEDEARAIIRFANGCVGDVMVSHISILPDKPKWELVGTKGSIRGQWTNSPIELSTRPKGNTVVEYVPLVKADWGAYYQNVLAHILDRKKLLVTGKSAARAIAVIETQARSARAGKSLPVPGE